MMVRTVGVTVGGGGPTYARRVCRKRFHYDHHAQLETHLADFIAAYNFGRHLRTLRGLTPYEFACKCWTLEPERFRLDPIHQMPGLNT